MPLSEAQSALVADDATRSGPLDLGPLTGVLGFHVRMAQVAIYRDFVAAMKQSDLTQKQFAVLSLLHTNPGSSQIALGAALGTDRATMMAIVDRLQDRGYLYRTRSKVDRRRQELYLTEDGLAVLADAKRRIAGHEKRFIDQFSRAELAQLIVLLGRIYAADETPL